MTAQLILVRHGQTASNGVDPDPRLSGWADLPLSPTGQLQVQALQRRFLRERPVDALYSSPLQRARDTALGLAPCCDSPLVLVNELREINCGEVDGLPISEVRQRCPSLWRENFQQTNDGFRWPGGESYTELRQRSMAVMERIAFRHAGQRVLIVTHAGVISQVLGALHGISPARWEPFRPENTSLTEIAWREKTGRMVSFNDHAHLAPLAWAQHSFCEETAAEAAAA